MDVNERIFKEQKCLFFHYTYFKSHLLRWKNLLNTFNGRCAIIRNNRSFLYTKLTPGYCVLFYVLVLSCVDIVSPIKLYVFVCFFQLHFSAEQKSC